MLPFLKTKGVAGLIVKTRTPDGPITEDAPSDDNQALEACADDILRAISSKDSKGLAGALKAAFDILDSNDDKPSPHTYEAQNESAGEN